MSGGGELASVEGTCQGDPLAMALYAVAISPMIERLQDTTCPSVKQSWYADDDAAADTLTSLRTYWNKLKEIGPGYGYFPNAAKTVLLTKPQHLQSALELFGSTGVAETSEGSRYLGGYLGTPGSCQEYAAGMVDQWTTEVRRLAGMAKTQPQASYTVLTKCLVGRWTYHLRCIDFDACCLQKMDDCIRKELLPALTGHEMPQDSPLRELLFFPARFGGLAVPVLSATAPFQRQASVRVTKPLVDLTLRSGNTTGSDQQVGGGELAGVSSPDGGVFDPLLPGRSAIRAQEARLDNRARSVWSRQQGAFFDVQVTHLKASLLSRSEALSQLKHHEQMKKRQYCARVNWIDRGTFTPLVFSTSGVCGPEASMFLKFLALKICTKHTDLHYAQVMGQLRSRLSFSLIRWAVTCFRGSRSSYLKRSGLSITQACRQLQP